MSVNLKAKIYTDEDAARAHLEKLQWPDGPVARIAASSTRPPPLQGQVHRPGVYKCGACRRAVHRHASARCSSAAISRCTSGCWRPTCSASSKKGISAHQLHRMLGVTYKTAWFMAHRIREAMAPEGSPAPIGGEGKTVEADETYIGNKAGKRQAPRLGRLRPQARHPRAGRAWRRSPLVPCRQRRPATKSVPIVARATSPATKPSIPTKLERLSHHAEFAATTPSITPRANTSAAGRERSHQHGRRRLLIFKRGMNGTYQHCGEQHLHRYLAEFDFRYNQPLGAWRRCASARCRSRSRASKASASPIGGLCKPEASGPANYGRSFTGAGRTGFRSRPRCNSDPKAAKRLDFAQPTIN